MTTATRHDGPMDSCRPQNVAASGGIVGPPAFAGEVSVASTSFRTVPPSGRRGAGPSGFCRITKDCQTVSSVQMGRGRWI